LSSGERSLAREGFKFPASHLDEEEAMVSATPVRETRQITQRELLGLVLGCAAQGSANFCVALRVAERMDDDADPRALGRELLTDLTIRAWIYLLREEEDGREVPLPRSRYEMELAADGNWDEMGGYEQARYALTEKGRAKLGPLLDSLPLPHP